VQLQDGIQIKKRKKKNEKRQGEKREEKKKQKTLISCSCRGIGREEKKNIKRHRLAADAG
jgi:hypothetical protein